MPAGPEGIVLYSIEVGGDAEAGGVGSDEEAAVRRKGRQEEVVGE